MRDALLPLLLSVTCLGGSASRAAAEEGFLSTTDGVRLYYERSGSGPLTVILPARLFLYPEFRKLDETFTVIAYDMRNRGRSDFVQDGSLLSLAHDVEDLETVRRHFEIETFGAVGYSYLGKMVVLYALAHPERVERIVQIGPVPMALETEYAADLRNDDFESIVDQERRARLRKLRAEGFHLQQPERYCEEEWLVTRVGLVGDPANAGRLGDGPCSMPNEWPTNLARHFFHHFGSMASFDVTASDAAELRLPVLTIHGRRDRNAPYGAGREWAKALPDARLVTVPGAAHHVWADRPEIVLWIRDFFLGRWPEGAESFRVDANVDRDAEVCRFVRNCPNIR